MCDGIQEFRDWENCRPVEVVTSVKSTHPRRRSCARYSRGTSTRHQELEVESISEVMITRLVTRCRLFGLRRGDWWGGTCGRLKCNYTARFWRTPAWTDHNDRQLLAVTVWWYCRWFLLGNLELALWGMTVCWGKKNVSSLNRSCILCIYTQLDRTLTSVHTCICIHHNNPIPSSR